MSGEDNEFTINIKLPKIKIEKMRISKNFAIGFFISIIISISLYYRMFFAVQSIPTHGYVSDELYYASTAVKYIAYVFNIHMPTNIVSSSFAANYWNFEHPPMGKYLTALSMLLFGYKGFRVLLRILVSLTPIILYLGIAYPFDTKDNAKIISAIVAGFILLASHIVAVEGSLVLLDSYAFFFGLISMVFALRKKFFISMFFAGLSVSSKETGLVFIVAGIIYFFAVSRGKLIDRIVYAIIMILISAVTFIVTYLPLMTYFGYNILPLSINTMIHWDTVSRASGPIASTPIDWVFGVNSMPFSLVMTNTGKVLKGVYASMTPEIEVLAMVLAFYSLVTNFVSKRIPKDVGTIYWLTTFFLFYIDYLKGDHTLYSMYSIVLVPSSAILIAGFVYSFLKNVRIKFVQEGR